MILALSLFHGVSTSRASMYTNIKRVLAVLAYALAWVYTWYCTSVGISTSYVHINPFVVMVWTLIVVTCVVVWFAASWAILALTLEKKRGDAHFVLLPLSLYATIAVGFMTLFWAFVAMNTTSGLDALGFAIWFATIAGAVLQYCIRHAMMAWQGHGIYRRSS